MGVGSLGEGLECFAFSDSTIIRIIIVHAIFIFSKLYTFGRLS